jgi:undecaprenyl pyrophosphate phosphatase UppP
MDFPRDHPHRHRRLLLNTCNSPLRDVRVIGWACVVMALLLGFAEIRARHRRTIEDASFVAMRCL